MVAALLLLAIGGLFVAKPIYRQARYWWYGRHLAEAEQAVHEGRMEKAKELSQTLLRAGDPRALEALRVLEQSMTALQDPFRVEIARALMSHPKGTREDRLRGFQLVVSEAPLGLAGQAWVFLREEDRSSADFAFAFADRLIESRRWKEAAGIIQAMPNAGTDWQAERRMIRIFIGTGNEYASVDAHNLLEKKWPADDKASALDLLELIPVDRLKPGLLKASAGKLDASVSREALMLARLAMAETDAPKEAIAEKAIADWRPTVPLEVGAFLRAAGMRSRLMAEFPPTELPKVPELTETLIESAIQEKDWEKAKEYLKAAPESFEKTTRLAWSAIAYAKAGDPAASDAAWREATIEASPHQEAAAWLKMAEILRGAGMEAQSHEAMYQAILRVRGRLPLFENLQALMEHFYEEDREKAMLQICSIYLLFEPGNPTLLVTYAYLACISGTGDPTLLSNAIGPLAKAFPDMPVVQAVLTTIHLFRNDFEEAGRVAARITVPLVALPPGYRAAILCARVKAGVLSAESEEVRGFPWQSVMQSEKRFYTRILEMKEPEKKPEEGKKVEGGTGG
ncbi:MAG: tetratricopeptide repeat protein [Verrucomicrobiales bacterium]